jgi:hypothetical protein
MQGMKYQRSNRKKIKSLLNPYKKKPISTKHSLANGCLGTISQGCEVGSPV